MFVVFFIVVHGIVFCDKIKWNICISFSNLDVFFQSNFDCSQIVLCWNFLFQFRHFYQSNFDCSQIVLCWNCIILLLLLCWNSSICIKFMVLGCVVSMLTFFTCLFVNLFTTVSCTVEPHLSRPHLSRPIIL